MSLCIIYKKFNILNKFDLKKSTRYLKIVEDFINKVFQVAGL